MRYANSGEVVASRGRRPRRAAGARRRSAASDRRQRGSVGGVRQQGSTALEHRDQAQRDERGAERRAGAGHHCPHDAGRKVTLGEARALEGRRADDHGQGDLAGDDVGVAPLETAPARRRERRAVARDAGREGEGLGNADHERVADRRLSRAAPLRASVRNAPSRPSRRAARARPVRGSPGAARSAARSVGGDRAAGAKESVSVTRLCGLNVAHVLRHLAPQADQQRERAAGVERHLERLAKLGIELAVRPAQQSRARARDGPSSRPAAARPGPAPRRARPRGVAGAAPAAGSLDRGSSA